MIDPAIHLNLVLEAKRCGIRRFVYVGVHRETHYADCRYILAHEAVRALLVAGGAGARCGMGELLEFFSKAGSADCVAPALGRRSMGSYFEKL